ncbi:hypothetical protein [Nocardioides sp. AX2bis]|uniref:hypothetical protein n=1 Tax=Nocardioides sp. AX2bis TaxID=2653157 RepID=UPI0012F45BDD|nr:hypothetical protein [Nocardioides sp. AX2bis]VXC22495.1 conserved hypothetical protein [Nocardioides sp. AX2bis]
MITRPPLRNREGEHAYDATWPWDRGRLRDGATAVLRVRDEARWLPYALPPLLRACDEVLLVDNGSRDGSAAVAVAAAARLGLGHRLRVLDYPFPVARAGAEHEATPPDSVHSLAYFYNWCFAQVRTRWSWKWDGDMTLTAEGEATLGDVGWQVGRTPVVVRAPRHGVYLVDDGHAWVDLGWRNVEEWGFPTGPDYVYAKAPSWEIRTTPPGIRTRVLPAGLVVELKHLDDDEFDHWTDPTAFSARTHQRKRREWEVVRDLRAGRVPDGLHEVVAPEGTGVVDHVVRTWLPGRPRPFEVVDPREGPAARSRRLQRVRDAAAALG